MTFQSIGNDVGPGSRAGQLTGGGAVLVRSEASNGVWVPVMAPGGATIAPEASALPPMVPEVTVIPPAVSVAFLPIAPDPLSVIPVPYDVTEPTTEAPLPMLTDPAEIRSRRSCSYRTR